MLRRIMNRRRFLSQSCLAAATFMAAQALPAPVFALGVSHDDTQVTQETRLLMGTMVTLSAHGAAKDIVLQAFDAAFAEIDRLIGVFDRHSGSSALGVLNAEGRLSGAPAELVALVNRSFAYGAASGQVFNPAVKPLVDLLAQHQTKESFLVVDKNAVQHALALADVSAVSVEEHAIRFTHAGMGLTLDGIAKGAIADAASRSLLKHGVKNNMVNAGGDIRVQGLNRQGRPWQIGIASPVNRNAPVEQIALSNAAVATSGGYEQTFDASGKTSHLVNPHTGESTTLAGVTVVAPTAEQADALATTLSLMTPHEGMQLVSRTRNTACLIFGKMGERYASSNWVTA